MRRWLGSLCTDFDIKNSLFLHKFIHFIFLSKSPERLFWGSIFEEGGHVIRSYQNSRYFYCFTFHVLLNLKIYWKIWNSYCTFLLPKSFGLELCLCSLSLKFQWKWVKFLLSCKSYRKFHFFDVLEILSIDDSILITIRLNNFDEHKIE